ncbi:MAG: S8 family serine peptidase [Opitutaceae bacterium]
MKNAGWNRFASALFAILVPMALSSISPSANAQNYDKLSTRLAGIFSETYRENGLEVADITGTMEFLGQIEVGDPNRYFVYVEIHPDIEYTLADIAAYFDGSYEEKEDWDLAAGWVLEPNLELLTLEPSVKYIHCVDRPHYKTGSVTTQGDALHNATTARSTRGLTGTGILVGVISDGVASLAAVTATNDLPGNSPPPPTVTIQGGDSGVGDEGTAMLEIIHDLAPGAELYFCPSGPSTMSYPTKISFANAMTALVLGANCNIVCDDVGWYSEPYFYDGYLANQVVGLGAGTNYIHVSAAGNDAGIHHQQTYTDNSPVDSEHDATLEFVVPAYGGVLEVWMQWNDQLGNAADYDVLLEDKSTGTAISAANYTRSGLGSGYPGEYAVYQNNGTQQVIVDVRVQYKGGNVNRTIEMFFEMFNGTTLNGTTAASMSATDAIIGHTAEPSVVAVGAVDHSTPTVIESFSSQGPVTHNDGQYIKPDIVATDNVSVTTPFYSPFLGTSAASPHVAGLLALAWEWSPEASASGLISAMTSTASDLGAPGIDNVFGSGFPDADLTAGALNLPPYVFTPGTTFNATLRISQSITGLSVSDPDAGSNNLTLTLRESSGTATIYVDDTISGGVTLADFTDPTRPNGSPDVSVTASAAKINATLADNNGVIYIGSDDGTPWAQSQSLIVTISDNGNTGYGGALQWSDTVYVLLHENRYQFWSREQFGSDVDDPAKQTTVWGWDANPDNDRYTNQWEFFIGIDPNVADTTQWFNYALSGSNFTYSFPISLDIDSNAYDVEYTNDLTSTWTPVPSISSYWSFSTHPTIPNADKVTITRPLSSGKEFLRIIFDPGYIVP